MFIRYAALLLCCYFGVLSTAKAETEPVAHWRFSHFLPAKHSLAQAMANWSERLQQASGGRIQITMFPASQLGSGLDHYDMVRTGVAHLAWIVPGYEQGRFPIFSLLETPFLISVTTGGVKAFHGWYPQYADLEMQEVIPCLFTASPPGRLNFKDRKVQAPNDLQGARIRVANATVGRYVRSLGGVTVNIPLSEARYALERGMMDGMPFGFYSIQSLSLDKALKKHLDMPFSSSPAIVGLRKTSYSKLPPELQTLLNDFCSPKESATLVAGWEKLEAAVLAQFKKNSSHDIYDVSPEIKRQWISKAEPLIEEWKTLAAKKGLTNPDQALEDLKAGIRAYDAEVKVIPDPAASGFPAQSSLQ